MMKHPLGEPPSNDLPLAVEIYNKVGDHEIKYRGDLVIGALYEAVRALEDEVNQLKTAAEEHR